jgi:hypothetical protein
MDDATSSKLCLRMAYITSPLPLNLITVWSREGTLLRSLNFLRSHTSEFRITYKSLWTEMRISTLLETNSYLAVALLLRSKG